MRSRRRHLRINLSDTSSNFYIPTPWIITFEFLNRVAHTCLPSRHNNVERMIEKSWYLGLFFKELNWCIFCFGEVIDLSLRLAMCWDRPSDKFNRRFMSNFSRDIAITFLCNTFFASSFLFFLFLFNLRPNNIIFHEVSFFRILHKWLILFHFLSIVNWVYFGISP